MIRKRGVKWQADISSPTRRYRKSFDNEAAALSWEAIATEAIRQGLEPPDPAKCNETRSIAAFYTQYKRVIFKGEIATIDKNANVVFRYIDPNTSLISIDTAAIDQMIHRMLEDGKAGGTINRKLAFISKVLKYAARHGLIDKVPTIERQREGEGNMRFITRAEEQAMFDYFEHMGLMDTKMFTQFLLYTGCRFSEPLQVRPRDLNDGVLSLLKTKTRVPRGLLLPEKALEAYEHFRAYDDARVFARINYQTYRGHWSRLKYHMGLEDDKEFVPHCLRHTCCSRLVQAGVDLRRTQMWMGHKAIQTTLRYAHLAPKDLDKCASALNNAAVDL